MTFGTQLTSGKVVGTVVVVVVDVEDDVVVVLVVLEDELDTEPVELVLVDV